MHSPVCPRTARLATAVALVLASSCNVTTPVAMSGSPILGNSQSFAVLAGSTVTNTGSSKIVGNVGVSPGSAITGFPPGTVTGGTIHAVAAQAQSDLTVAYNDLAGRPCNFDLTGQDLGGKVLTEGVYCFTSSAQLTGPLVLDAQGNANAVFIFQIASTLTTASSSSVSVINAGQDCNVYWQIGSSTTLGTGTSFVGNILALTSIAVTKGTTISGRAHARNGAVTLDTNHIEVGNCPGAGGGCSGGTVCDQLCVNTGSDPQNCSACGNVCAPAETCVSGICTPAACSGTLCGSACIDLSIDPNNCGSCSNVCNSGECCVSGVCL